jgi:hypothetical protein
MHKCYCVHCCLFPSRTSLFCFFSNVIILHRILWSAILKLDFYPPHILFTVIVEYLKLIRLDMMHFILKPNNSHRKTSISYKGDMVSLCQVAGIKSVTTEMISFQQSFHVYISLLLNGISYSLQAQKSLCRSSWFAIYSLTASYWHFDTSLIIIILNCILNYFSSHSSCKVFIYHVTSVHIITVNSLYYI